MALTDSEKQTIAEEYLAGESLRKIAAKHHITPCAVSWAAKCAGVMPGRDNMPPAFQKHNDKKVKDAAKQRKKIVGMYCNGMRAGAVASKLKISQETVYAALRRENIPLRHDKRIGNRSKTAKEKAAIVQAYLRGDTVGQICAKYHTTQTSVYHYLKEAGTPLRQPGKSNRT